MKQKAIKATVLAAIISAQAGEAGAEDYKKNPFTLTKYVDAAMDKLTTFYARTLQLERN